MTSGIIDIQFMIIRQKTMVEKCWKKYYLYKLKGLYIFLALPISSISLLTLPVRHFVHQFNEICSCSLYLRLTYSGAPGITLADLADPRGPPHRPGVNPGWPRVTLGLPRTTPVWPRMTLGWPRTTPGWPRTTPSWTRTPLGDPG